MELKDTIRAIEDYPKEGVIFRDITTLLKDKDAFKKSVDEMAAKIDDDVDKIIGIEARGFIFGAALAYKLNKGFIPVRKPGKLPWDKISESYDLEYGEDSIEIHEDAIEPGEKVVIVDDLLATGGTSKACLKLVRSLGGEVSSLVFLAELEGLKARDELKGEKVHSVIRY
ncbi:MAG: adenine phosphoribosyltransferase [Peptoniphilus harei]|uniref:adenine phosphoribosyltransferase n=1 Tax=Peptoniphilus harei TaxID=54005 RepID=UPI002910F339|nr:adenine phosphoribosyltransferase [Peptoniphilus harei]MDU5471455.1 adenine phosphoribosyltransferase [Peptoniphilus harei]MDU6098186.1 adenine phosphoribosyltransferase [Peptoniphilus harei]